MHEGLVRLADGDRTAFEPVFNALWPVLRAFARRALKEAPEAEDVAQQALIELFNRIDELDPERDGVSWALRIVSYKCWGTRTARRRQKEVLLGASTPDPTDPTQNPETQAIQRDLEAAAHEVLGQLSEQDRLALTGERAGVAPATWRKRRQRARQRFLQIFRRTYGDLG